MIYRICRVINITICFLFIILALYSVVVLNDFSANSLTMAGIVFITYALLLWFNFICNKLDKYNKERIILSRPIKNTGKVFFILVLFIAIGIFVSAVAAWFSFSENYSQANKWQRTSFAIFIVFFILTAITAISNLIFFTKSIKKNKLVVNEFINDIGTPA
jgi:membrane protease YdiL (CAAX protease family)